MTDIPRDIGDPRGGGIPLHDDGPRTVTRADLLDGVARTCPHLSRVQVRGLVEMTLDEVSDALVRGDNVRLRSFGLFAVRAKRERIGRNPRTGAAAAITPRRVLTFKASPCLLDHVNGHAPDEATMNGMSSAAP